MTTPEPIPYDVIIVGGGISGLSAAHYLRKARPALKIIILEAKDRLGGRTYTVDINGAQGPDKWDLGGQWVATSQGHIMSLVNELNLETLPQYLTGTKLMQLGDMDIKSYEGSIPRLSFFSLVDLAIFQIRGEKLAASLNPLDVYSNENSVRWDSMTAAEMRDKLMCSREARQAFDVGVRTCTGMEPNRISALFILYYASCAGGLMKLFEACHGSAQESKVKGGTQQICFKLAERIGNDNIRTSSPVSKIIQGDLCSVHTSEEIVYGRQVIMAAPPQCAANIEYEPPLPESKMLLLRSALVGHLSKFIVTYNTAFWRENGFSGEIVCNCGYYSGVLPGEPFSAVFDASTEKSPALVGFYSGGQGVYWASKPHEERKEATLRLLAKFFGDDALTPIDFREKIWSLESYNGGCPVSCFGPGVMHLVDEHWRTSFKLIHWAGTETATEWCGYMSGAVQAGERAAKEVLYNLFLDDISNLDLSDTEYSYSAGRLSSLIARQRQNQDPVKPYEKDSGKHHVFRFLLLTTGVLLGIIVIRKSYFRIAL